MIVTCTHYKSVYYYMITWTLLLLLHFTILQDTSVAKMGGAIVASLKKMSFSPKREELKLYVTKPKKHISKTLEYIKRIHAFPLDYMYQMNEVL